MRESKIQILKKSLDKLTLEELYKEIEIQEEKMDIYTEDSLDYLVADCAWYIVEIENEIEKRAINDSNQSIWVIGDVHGEYDKLAALIEKLPKDAHICFVGDLIDRGKRSAYVLELLVNSDYDCVLGNHEIFMLEDNPLWHSNYGKKTIKSYYSLGFEKRPNHMKYLRRVPYFRYYEFQGHKPLVVSHSYIHDIWQGKEFKYDEKDLDAMTWKHMTKQEQFDEDKEIQNGIYNIFGHTVLDEVVVTQNYAMIDTGACFKAGKLSAICYPTLEIVQV